MMSRTFSLRGRIRVQDLLCQSAGTRPQGGRRAREIAGTPFPGILVNADLGDTGCNRIVCKC